MFLPIDITSRQIVNPQKHVVLSDDLLLEDDFSRQNTDTIHPIQKLVSQPLGPSQTSYYQALVKKGHSYNELTIINSHLLVQLITNPS